MSAKHRNHSWKLLELKIRGMHCVNCEVLIERRFKKIAGVRRVKANYSKGMAEITYYGDLDINALQSAVADDGYTVSSWHEKYTKSPNATNTRRDYAEIAAGFFIFVALYFILGQYDVFPQNLSIPNNISFALAFLIGVVASMSTCIAVTGGLLVAVAAKYNNVTTGLSSAQRFKPHIFFNAGRIISYTLFGGGIGALGSTFTLSVEASGLLTILASIIMVVLGLQMLNLFSWLKALQPRMPKFLAHKIYDLTEKEVKGGAFILGACTFFLPCGFTQALQLYVLATGSFMTGALVMLAFSLGTLPALVSLSALSSFARGSLQRYFLKFAGVTVVILGIFNIQSGLTLSGVSSGTPTPTVSEPRQPSQQNQPSEQVAPIVDGKQIVDMKIVGYTYEPHQFVVVAGVPVEWRIDARQSTRCGRILIAPRAGVRQFLSSTDTTVVSFTPLEAGDIGFNCGMRMMTRGSKFIVHANTTAPSAASAQASVPAQMLSADQRGEIEGIIRDYLLRKPEVLQDANAELKKRQQMAEAEQRRTVVKEYAAVIFSSPRQVVLGNPKGDVTMVEFIDYNSGHCKQALGDMLDLLKTDPNLKVVLKEFPMLGNASVEAATVAIAVRMQDQSGRKYLEFHQKLLGGRGQGDRTRALATAKEVGLDMTRLERDMASPEVKATIEENLKLAEALGISGTPTYVIGTEVVVGAVGRDVLKEKVSAARR